MPARTRDVLDQEGADLGRELLEFGDAECVQFPAGESWKSLGLDGTEIVSISGLEQLNEGITPKTVRVVAEPSEFSPEGKQTVEFDAVVRIDTPGEADYYRNGGILQYVLRSLV